MEKLIYVVSGGEDDAERGSSAWREGIAPRAVAAARSVGGERMALLVPDRSDEIRARNRARIGGPFASLCAAFECWLPSLDDRAPVEEALRASGGALWGYLATESTVVPCPHVRGEGERVPGITQWGINGKPKDVAMDSFFHEWQVVHSQLSFALHPLRESYSRNALVRPLTAEAPPGYLAVVLERFPSLEDFTDDARYFGEASVVKQMVEHLPTFYDFGTAITGGMSEYRYA